ncbi:outer membrane lipoprotein chaperone LolA [Exilibacterium tricleocarpae]|nr:outer membrane lipoprotein chaperone LolA [Exilibacterium tricleocarpae]
MRSLSLLLLFICSGLAQAASTASPVEQLSQLLAPMQTLTGSFQQTMLDRDGELLEQSSGLFALKKPGRFRWQTKTPYDQLLVGNQQKLWLYDPDLEQVTVRAVDQRMQQTPALLLSGEVEQIRAQFNVDVVESGTAQQAFALQPKGKNNLFESLVVKFAAGKLSEMVLADSLGQTTTIRLGDLAVNPSVDDQQFNFIPPPGTDVLVDE